MQQLSSDNTRRYEVAYENYIWMKEICMTLSQDGYWDEPERLLKYSIYEALDVYVQSVLIEFIRFTNRTDKASRQFVTRLVECDMLDVGDEGEIPSTAIKTSKKVYGAPPILLQLCGVRDCERESDYGSLFVDRMLSILLAIASIDEMRNKQALIFVEQFYDRMIQFVNVNQVKERIPKRYLFKKMTSEAIEPLESIKHDEKKHEMTKATKSDIESNEESEETTSKSTTPKLEEPAKQKPIQEDKLAQLLAELNGLIGLDKVKTQINSLINLIKVRSLREEYGMPLPKMTYHMVFTGNPGTGKTTVARLVAKIYKELGILKTGTFVETDRSGLVAGYVGQTAIKVKEVVNSALGGVLFIDEAYSLTNQTVANDFGGEAIDTLVKMMEDHRDDLIIIVAGYKDEMSEFLKSNSGLVSRFNTFIEFEDYTENELMDILLSLAKQSGMEFSRGARQKVKKQLKERSEMECQKFGNARGIRNLFERILMNQANRVVKIEAPTKDEVSTIEARDIQL